MTSYTRRYTSGDHEAVWNDLRHLGPVPDTLDEDCRSVASATMRRVARHVDRLAEQLTVLHGVSGRPGITLVEYLRVSIAWGATPGWSFKPDAAPAALAALRARPDF